MAHHVSEEECIAVLLYMQSVKTLLRIQDWHFSILNDPAYGGAHATVDTVVGRYIAQLSLATDWMDKDEHTKRCVLLHEGLHVVHLLQERTLYNHFENKTQITEDHWDLARTAYSEATEMMVDKINAIIISIGGLPTWPTAAAVKKASLDELQRLPS